MPAVAAGADIRTIFAELDQNGDNRVDRTEFLVNQVKVLVSRDANQDTYLTPDETAMKPEAFNLADRDRDGRISGFEFLVAPFVRFEFYDTNADGVIMFEEMEGAIQGLSK